jgi:hypothetical protein
VPSTAKPAATGVQAQRCLKNLCPQAKNGYENWVWMHDHACLTSDGSDGTVGGEGGMRNKAVLCTNAQKGQETLQAGMEDG